MIESLEIITIISVIIFAFTSIYGKIIIEEVGSSYNFFLLQISLLIPVLLAFNLLIIPDLTYITSVPDLLQLILASILSYIGYLFLYRGFELGNVSVGGVLLSSRVLISIPLAFVIGELYPLLTYFFILVTLFGATLVSWHEGLKLKDFLQFKSSGVNYFLVTLVCWAISNSLTRNLNNHYSPFLFLLIRIFFFTILAIVTYPFMKKILLKGKNLIVSKKLIGMTFIYVLILVSAQFLYIYALGISLTIAEGLGVLEGAFTFLLAVGLSKINYFKDYLQEPMDRITVLVRSVGMLLATIGSLGVILIIQNP